MITGRNKIHLKDNVVAIGLASCFIEPLQSTGIYLTTSAVHQLCQYIDGEITENEYNNFINEEYDALVDFIIAHYKYSRRNNSYWNHYKNIPIVHYRKMQIFPKDSWDYILNGFGYPAEVPKPIVNPYELINIYKGTPYHEWMLSGLYKFK